MGFDQGDSQDFTQGMDLFGDMFGFFEGSDSETTIDYSGEYEELARMTELDAQASAQDAKEASEQDASQLHEDREKARSERNARWGQSGVAMSGSSELVRESRELEDKHDEENVLSAGESTSREIVSDGQRSANLYRIRHGIYPDRSTLSLGSTIYGKEVGMTISSTLSKVIYGGNDSTASFAIPFMFLRDEDVDVVLTDSDGVESLQVISSDYQLSGAGEQTGGVCTMVIAPAQGQTLVIRRNPAMVQEVDYVENDAFPAATHESALDKLTMICQSLAERLDRTITFRISSAVTGVNLPEPSPGQALAWNETGDNLVNKLSADMGPVLLPLSVAEGGTGGDNADDALSNLGFGSAGRALAACETELEAVASIDAEPADPAILRADLPDLLTAVYGDEAHTHVGTDLSSLAIERNHILWTLTEDSQFSDVTLPYDGTYVFHVYPNGYGLVLASTYKTNGALAAPDTEAGEVRIAVEQFGGRKTIVSLQNMEA